MVYFRFLIGIFNLFVQVVGAEGGVGYFCRLLVISRHRYAGDKLITKWIFTLWFWEEFRRSLANLNHNFVWKCPSLNGVLCIHPLSISNIETKKMFTYIFVQLSKSSWPVSTLWLGLSKKKTLSIDKNINYKWKHFFPHNFFFSKKCP